MSDQSITSLKNVLMCEKNIHKLVVEIALVAEKLEKTG